MDKLLWMRCFVRAVETGSFSAVARELGIGQPNVSRYVAALEKSLGTRLLHRSTRQMVATA
jgi:LysR family transcriptional regulator for bpeEF and oprC